MIWVHPLNAQSAIVGIFGVDMPRDALLLATMARWRDVRVAAITFRSYWIGFDDQTILQVTSQQDQQPILEWIEQMAKLLDLPWDICPFCGGKADYSVNQAESLWSSAIVPWHTASCRACDISMSRCDDLDGLVDAWNTRTPDPRLAAWLESRGLPADWQCPLDAAAVVVTHHGRVTDLRISDRPPVARSLPNAYRHIRWDHATLEQRAEAITLKGWRNG